MEEQLVSFEVAKLAKEKGFNEKCSHSYKQVSPIELYQHQDKKYTNSFQKVWVDVQRKNTDMLNANEFRCSAPTQSLLQKWLREEYKIDLDSCTTFSRKYSFMIYKGAKPYPDYIIDDFDSYEEALETALLEALKLIDNESK